jgi:hypothetical protein
MTGGNASDRAIGALSVEENLVYLQQTLGVRMAAYLADLPHTSLRAADLQDENAASSVAKRLRGAYETVRLVVEVYDAETARTWLFGTNSFLDDEAPIELRARVGYGFSRAEAVAAPQSAD